MSTVSTLVPGPALALRRARRPGPRPAAGAYWCSFSGLVFKREVIGLNQVILVDTTVLESMLIVTR